ncbi:MAG: Uma2 family endonuclease [Bacteroidota bacterium]
MDVAHSLRKYSIEEYIQLEQETDTKYEYYDGEVFAMAGGTLNHSEISGNIFSDLKNILESKNSSCRTFNSDAKLSISKRNKYVYPDTMVVYGDVELSSRYKEAITNSILIIEVLSGFTAAYDRGNKFKSYRSIPSLQEYILIEQDKSQVDISTRKGDFWRFHSIEGLEKTLVLTSIDVEIPLSRIYRNVSFDAVFEEQIK